MIVSKWSLLTHKAATTKGGRRALQGVKMEKDGTMVAANGEMVVAIEPPDPSKVTVPLNDMGTRVTLGESGVLLPARMLEKALKTLPKDKRVSLQHFALSRTPDPGKLGFISLDAAGNTSLVEAAPMPYDYPDWRKPMQGSASVKICVNKRALSEMLKLVDEMTPNTTNVFLEVDLDTNKIIARGINGITAQRVIASTATVNTMGRWLPRSAWEDGILSPETGEKKQPPPRRGKDIRTIERIKE